MKTPKELAGLEESSNKRYIISNLSVAMDQACLEGKITKDGGVFEVVGLERKDWQVISDHFEDYKWHAVIRYDVVSEKYVITLTQDLSIR